MLAFARQQDLRTTSADIGALVCGMRELLRRSLGPQIALHLHIDPDLPPAEVDPHQVELAVLNLAINARDAMPESGVINIRVGQRHLDGDYGLRPGTYLRIRISDTGCGMDAATLAKAIEPFFSTKPLGKGTGLGLSMTHGLAVQLGGHLDLASEIGVGTVATLWLPMATGPAAKIAPVAGASAPVRAATILVVDDDPLIAMSKFGKAGVGNHRRGPRHRSDDDRSGDARNDGHPACGNRPLQTAQSARAVGNRIRRSTRRQTDEPAAPRQALPAGATAG
jgi:anti-sigma regulatory factor (Ser/Thr protein kinase)